MAGVIGVMATLENITAAEREGRDRKMIEGVGERGVEFH